MTQVKKSKPRSNYNPYQPNIAAAVRDVLLASINKGQFPVATVCLVLLGLIWKMPAESAGEIAKEVLKLLENFHILGWILGVVGILLWYFDSKKFRSFHAIEMDRVSDEKKELQERLLGFKLTSSNRT